MRTKGVGGSRVDCEVCGAATRPWLVVNGYQHFKCRACAHVHVSPKPGQRELEAYYDSGAYYQGAEGQAQRLEADARARLLRLNQLCKRYGLELRILDVGCASGLFLREAISGGWNGEGIERSDATAASARKAAGAMVHSVIIEDAVVRSAPFSVVSAWEVIEHTVDPRRFLRAMVRQVRPGGLVALSTPMIDGLPARVLGRSFPMLIPPEHLSLFSRRSLSILAGECGLAEVAFRSFSNLSPQSLANGMCRRLCGAGVMDVGVGWRSLFQAAGVLLGWVPRLVDAIGMGSEMEVVYRVK